MRRRQRKRQLRRRQMHRLPKTKLTKRQKSWLGNKQRLRLNASVKRSLKDRD